MPLEDKPISGFSPAPEITPNTVLFVSTPDGQGGYGSNNTTAGELGEAIASSFEYTQEINTEEKTLTGSINELLTYVMNIAEEYDPAETYAVGDFRLHEGVLYKCTTPIPIAEAWTAAHWTSTLIVDNFGTGGGGSGTPVLYGTTDPAAAQGTDGQMYAKYENLVVVSVSVKIYKPTDAQTVQITITEDGSTVYTASPACSVYGEYSEITTNITLNSGTYTLKHRGENVQTRGTPSQFVEINGNEIGFIADGNNSSYRIDETQTLTVVEGGQTITKMWLKISTDWCPIKLEGEGGAATSNE